MAQGCKIPTTRRDWYHSQFSKTTCHESGHGDDDQQASKHHVIGFCLNKGQCHQKNISDDRIIQKDSNSNTENTNHHVTSFEDTVQSGFITTDDLHPTDLKDQLPPSSRTTSKPLLTNTVQELPHQQQDFDYVDYICSTNTFSFCDFVIYLFSLLSYLADVGTDIWVAYMYFHENHMMWFALTLIFILVPAIIMTSFSLAWYIQDYKHSKNHPDTLPYISKVQWTSRTICLLLQIGPVIRYIECLLYGVRSKKERHWYTMLVFEDTDSTLLRLLECFMEATPQLILQLYVMITLGLDGGWLLVIGQIASSLTSLCSVCWSLVSYHRALRYSLDNKANVTYGGMALQFFWRIFTIGSRIITLAVFTAAYRYWVFIAVASHWIVMFIWILVQKTKFCNTQFKEFFFNIVMAIVYIFCYVNLLEGHTRLRYIFFYSVMYVENLALMVGWYAVAGTSSSWYVIPVIISISVCPFVGWTFMIAYYKYHHPNNLSPSYSDKCIKTCIPWHDLYLCQQPPESASEVISSEHSHELQNLKTIHTSHV